uniref:hypothetical protein n=1 Tax=Candidatus Protofrankia datiscae TaxID=2716812 RepID=UPI0019D2B3E4
MRAAAGTLLGFSSTRTYPYIQAGGLPHPRKTTHGDGEATREAAEGRGSFPTRLPNPLPLAHQ